MILQIPGGVATAAAAIAAAVPTNAVNDRFCGRRFVSVTAMGADAMICSKLLAGQIAMN